MRLWTIQTPDVLQTIEKTGRYICDKEKSTYYENCKDAFDWLMYNMDNHLILRPEGVESPIWAWYTYDWKHEKPDLTNIGREGIEYVCIELEIPDIDVLLSDEIAWHYVLNNDYYNPADTEQVWEELEDWYDNLSKFMQNVVKLESWEYIFNIRQFDTGFASNGQYVQATFWEIRKENIISVEKFISK